MDTAATELECFQALQKQEVMAASYRVSSLVEEVNKQKELERSLQQRYGDLIAEHDRVRRLLEEHRERLRVEEEIAAKNRALEEEMAAKQRAHEEEMAAKQRAHEEEITAKNQALEEETTAKGRELEEESMTKSHTVDEEMTDVSQQQLVSEAVDACRLDSGLNRTYLPISDLTETNVSKEAAPACNSQLHAETSNDECTAARDQEGLDHLKDATTSVDTNAKLVEDVTGFGADGRMMVDSDGLQNENFHPQAGVDGLNTNAACNLGGIDEMMIVDSNSQLVLIVLFKPSQIVQLLPGLVGESAVVSSDSLNADSGSVEWIIGDSSNQVAAPISVGSGGNIIPDSSDHAITGEKNTAANTTVNPEIPADINVLASGTGDMEST